MKADGSSQDDRSAGTPLPLSDYSLSVLRSLKIGPEPRQAFNSGACGLLEKRGFIETFEAPTPYKTRKGLIQWVRLTQAGLERIAT